MLRRAAVRATIGVLHESDQGKLEIDLYGDLAGILSLAANYNGRREPNHSNERSVDLVHELKVVAGERNQRYLQALVSLIPTLTALTPKGPPCA